MRNYISEQSAGDLVRNIYALYFSNFVAIYAMYLIPFLPLASIQMHAQWSHNDGLSTITTVLLLLAGVFITAPMTVAVSDACLGNRPGVARSYRLGFRAMLRQFLPTWLLLVVVVFCGFLLLLIPGLVFSVWYMFTIPIVVLERVVGRGALRRSKELGKGFYLRNFLIIFIISLVTTFVHLLFSFVTGFVGGFVAFHFSVQLSQSLLAPLLMSLVGLVFAPTLIIAPILLYYDMRARKEGYDSAILARDLRR